MVLHANLAEEEEGPQSPLDPISLPWVLGGRRLASGALHGLKRGAVSLCLNLWKDRASHLLSGAPTSASHVSRSPEWHSHPVAPAGTGSRTPVETSSLL